MKSRDGQWLGLIFCGIFRVLWRILAVLALFLWPNGPISAQDRSESVQHRLGQLLRSGGVAIGTDRMAEAGEKVGSSVTKNGVVFEGEFADLQREHRQEIIDEAMEEWRNMQRGRGDLIVAIDGCAGVGKTSVARALARDYGLLFVSTGEEYRALTAYLLDRKIGPDDENMAGILEDVRVETAIENGEAHLTFDGLRYGPAVLRGPAITEKVSAYAKNPALRSFLLREQRAMLGRARRAHFSGLVMEGRDTTTAVFPTAQFRFVLDASPQVRAQRRAREGINEDLLARDRKDHSQMRRGRGVLSIDTSDLTLQEVIAVLKKAIETGRVMHDGGSL